MKPRLTNPLKLFYDKFFLINYLIHEKMDSKEGILYSEVLVPIWYGVRIPVMRTTWSIDNGLRSGLRAKLD